MVRDLIVMWFRELADYIYMHMHRQRHKHGAGVQDICFSACVQAAVGVYFIACC
jgi:hypothetical protein